MKESRSVVRRPLSRRTFIRAAGVAGAGFVLYAYTPGGTKRAVAAIPGGNLDPVAVPKFVTPLLIPPVMPRAGTISCGRQAGRLLRDLGEAVLAADPARPDCPRRPSGATARSASASKKGLLIHHAPSLTIEAQVEPAGAGQVDQRPRGRERRLPAAPAAGRPDAALGEPARWRTDGPRHAAELRRDAGSRTPDRCPIVTHVHGAVGVGDESDGYAEAWYLPAAEQHPRGLRDGGHLVRLLQGQGRRPVTAPPGGRGSPSSSTRTTSASRRSGTTTTRSGMTRLNVYAGPAGFFLVRGGPAGRQGDPRQPLRRHRRAARSRADRGRQVPAQQDLLRDPDRDPGPGVQRRRVAVLPRQPRVLRRRHGRGPGFHPRHRPLADLEPGVLRQHDHGQRQHVAVPDRRAAALPAPLPQRLPVPLPDPGLQPDPGRARSGPSATRAASWPHR